MVMKRSFAVMAMVAAVSSVFAVYGRLTGPSDSDSTFTWVGRVGNASGTVIAPNWVLTARHVSGTFNLNGTDIAHDARFEHPTSDLALLRFSTPFAGFHPLFNGSALGREASIVGFGNSGTPRTNLTGYNWVTAAGTRRAVTNNVGLTQTLAVNYGGSIGVLNVAMYLADLDSHDPGTPAPYDRDWFGDGGATSNEGNVSVGDSGGSWLVDDGGVWKVAGVTSVRFFADPLPAGATGDPDPFMAFGVSGSGAVNLNDPNNWNWIQATMVPEPATLIALGIGIAATLRRRRK